MVPRWSRGRVPGCPGWSRGGRVAGWSLPRWPGGPEVVPWPGARVAGCQGGPEVVPWPGGRVPGWSRGRVQMGALKRKKPGRPGFSVRRCLFARSADPPLPGIRPNKR